MQTTFVITSPHGCGEVVAAFDAGFSATSVDVRPCTHQRADGIVSITMRKSAAYATETVASVVLRHRDGLVSFGGSR